MRVAGILVVLGLTAPVLAAPSQGRALTFEQRVAAQHAIEQVYWSHRIWPESNSGTKPPLSAVLSDAAIRAKVAAYLEESNALDRVWRRPISASQLQAELDRMVGSTRAPDVLRELYAALGNDAQLIAETLGRQTLADRLARGWYAFDERLHGDVKRHAERALASCADTSCMRTMGGRYTETTWKRQIGGPDSTDEENGHRIVFLDAEQWKTYRERWAGRREDTSDAHPRTTLGRLEETEDGFSVAAVLSESAEALTTASVVWDKQPFDEWWRSVGGGFGTTIESPRGEYSITAPATRECTIDTWSRVPQGVEPRYGQTAVWTGTEMIVWGGYGNGGGLDSGGRYNPDTDTWVPTSQEPNTPLSRFEHTAVWTGTEMIVWGGGGSQGLKNSGGRYDPSTDSWKPTSTGTDVPLARHGHVAVWTGSRMIVWGGQNPSSGNGYLNTGGLYDPSSNTWKPTSVGAGVPISRTGHAVVWTGTEMIVWGGADDTPYSLNSGGRYDPSTDVWRPTAISANTPGGVWSPTAVWTGTHMIVWGGGGSSSPPTGFTNEGGRYDPSTDTWLPTSRGSRVPQGRVGHAAVWTGSEMIVWGGEDRRLATNFDSGGRYNPISDSWTVTHTAANTPTARAYATSVWTGTEMIVWGGRGDGEEVFNSGGRYSPSMDSWLATAIPGDPPAERTLHTAVWTGAEMIVWGGQFSDGSALRTGGHYTLATSTWRPTSTGSNTPSARYDHTAVWTGTEMIVWGGNDGNHLLYSGGRYDPSSDTWHTTARNGAAPTARTGHVAVWTGSEMIVWGGDDGVSLLNTGGRYAPASNSWSATTTAGVPSGRKGTTAVWTGSEMIAWGGQGSGLEKSGGRYDPSSNSWQATSLGAGVPSGRVGHTAVWTGTKMIVWGGDAGVYGTMENTGGRYDPADDSWAPTMVSGSPAGRSDHTAVWTGTEMIVWGGADAYTTLNSGGRYIPLSNSWLPTSTAGRLPVSRTLQTAIWTGREMIVWGGNRTTGSAPPYDYLTSTGGAYCTDSCASPATLYRDADSDGYGNPIDSQVTCASPAGWVALAGDCDDTKPFVHPGAPEVCNGLDDDCDIAIDEGIPAPSESPVLTESKYGTATSLFWTEVPNATGYDVIVGDLAQLDASGGDFATSTTGCILNDSPYLSTVTLGIDPPGGSWYLVRAVNACSGNGSYDDGHQQGSRDAEIAASASACP